RPPAALFCFPRRLGRGRRRSSSLGRPLCRPRQSRGTGLLGGLLARDEIETYAAIPHHRAAAALEYQGRVFEKPDAGEATAGLDEAARRLDLGHHRAPPEPSLAQ